MSELSDFNTVPQAAAYMNIPERTLYDLIRAEKIGHVRMSERVIRIRRADIEAFLASNVHPAKEADRA
jgi:excisionase family DNA binding protein